MTITIPAAKCTQGDLVLYSTSMKVKDLMQDGFYSVEKLDPEDDHDRGYQRVLNKNRAKKLADYLLKGQESQDAFLPTSILLATDKHIEQDGSNNTITISLEEIGPFSVVDGQHRLEGLRMAAEKDERVLDLQVPINIAISLNTISQMCHFLIVNTTQKSVDKSVEQRIYARLTESVDVEDIPSLPKWIRTIIDRGEVHKALKIVDYLNSEPESPWRGRIAMANEAAKKETTVKQGSFVTLINKHFLVASNPLEVLGDFDKEKKVFLNYWVAVCDILDDGVDSVLFKYNGVALFCSFAIPFFGKLTQQGRSFTVETMKEQLQNCFDSMEGEYAGVGLSEWWHKGGHASGINTGAIAKVVHEMTRSLNKKDMGTDIEV